MTSPANPSGPGPSRFGPAGLGPQCVGHRVVVRRVLPGELGPSGGPAMTDLLGVMESWDGEVTTVRGQDGAVTVIEIAHIVSGKPVPPRPPPRLRVGVLEAELHAAATWPAMETAPLGEWLLRASSGFSDRANSVLAVGDPGLDLEAALARARDFYRAHGLRPLAQVEHGSGLQRLIEAAGWVTARPGEAETLFQIGSVARVARAARAALPASAPEVSLRPALGGPWLANDARARGAGAAGRAVLEGPADVAFAEVLGEDRVVAKGRVALSPLGARDWAGLSDLWVDPERRRHGLAVAVIAALLGWAAEHGASSAFLQTRADNPAAVTLYERLGFSTHHAYVYLTPS